MATTKLCLFLVLLAVAVAPLSSYFTDHGGFLPEDPQAAALAGTLDNSKRLLFEYGWGYPYPRNRYLSYDALKKNNIPCGHRGNSYYDCTKRQRANPYRRGCTAITGCARFTD